MCLYIQFNFGSYSPLPRDGSDRFSEPAKHVVLPLTEKDANLGAKRRYEWSESDE